MLCLDWVGLGDFSPHSSAPSAYLQQVPVHRDGDPVVGGEGDGQQGRRHEAEDGGEGQGHRTTEAHHYWLSLCLSL